MRAFSTLRMAFSLVAYKYVFRKIVEGELETNPEAFPPRKPL
jgi:hypothetical protein